MRRLPLIVICAAVLIVGIGGVLWWKAGQTTPVSERAALAGYREDAVSGGDRRGPAPGVYTYDQVGREKNRFGPLAINRDLPAEARYTITATPDGYREELALAEQHIEGKRFRLRADGARQATWRRNNITFLGVGRDDRKEINPPALSLPASLPVGRTWSAEYDAGSIHVRERARVLCHQAVRVDGRRHATVVVRTVARSTGVLGGKRVDTIWWSPELHLPLRWTIEQHLDGRVSLTTTTDLHLRETAPRT